MNPALHFPALRGAFARVLVALASLVFVVAGQPARANAPAPEQSTSRYEIRCMEEMIEHHMMAIHMSEICLGKAVHPELLEQCQEIITAQQQEISTMQQWLSTWYDISGYQPEMNPRHHRQMEKLAMLGGAEFEIEFMQQMIRHHRMAIVKGSQCVERAYHEELQDMCTEIVVSQSAEIQQMQDWLCSWYGLCRPRHQR